MKKFALLGFNIDYSLSPLIHKIIYSELGEDAGYCLESVSPENLENSIKRLKKEYDGFNVTQPHKNAVTKYLDYNFSEFNAVNTVKNNSGKLEGYNTDGYGLKTHLEYILGNDYNYNGKNVLIIGAGGMGETAAKVFKKQNANTFITNRTMEKAERIAKAHNITAIENIENTEFNIIINCSSAFLTGGNYDGGGINESKLELCYDTIYFETGFQKYYKSNGKQVACGKGMLICQAIKADEIFFSIELCDNDREKLYKKLMSKI